MGISNCHYYEIYNEKSKKPILLTNRELFEEEEFIKMIDDAKSNLKQSRYVGSDNEVASYLINKYKFSSVKYTMKP